MIEREHELEVLRGLLRRHPVVAIIGARQVGKTTLARAFAAGTKGPVTYFDLENTDDMARLGEPMLALGRLKGLVVIDEIQRYPDLFTVLRVLVDRRPLPARFLILGSASPDLLHQSSESLAGRIHYHQLKGLSLDEVGTKRLMRLWVRGGFPRSYLARSDDDGNEWRRAFIRTFLERDLPQLGIMAQSTALRRFWTMLAHYHGQIWNTSELSRSLGVSDKTVRHYLDVLTSALVVQQLPPWHENISKRQVKSPKVYLADSGLLHTLLGLMSLHDIEGHPKAGSSWEGFCLGQVIQRLAAWPEECFFWATYSGAELDLLVMRGRKRLGFEFKRTSAPHVTPSMHSALSDLDLTQLNVIHGGDKTFPMGERIRAVAMSRLQEDLKPLHS